MNSIKLNQLENDIANFLLDKLEQHQITIERAAEISQYIRHTLPNDLTDEQIDKIIPSLDDEFVELAGIVHKNMIESQDKIKREEILKKLSTKVHQKI